MAIIPNYSSATLQAPGATYETCFEMDVSPATQLLRGIKAVRFVNDPDATAAAFFRVNGTDELTVCVLPGQDAIVRIDALIKKVEVKGTGASVAWNPCIA